MEGQRVVFGQNGLPCKSSLQSSLIAARLSSYKFNMPGRRSVSFSDQLQDTSMQLSILRWEVFVGSNEKEMKEAGH